MKEVIAYQTDDGLLFKTKEAAEEVERIGKLEESIYNFIAKHGWSGMYVSDITKILVENISELKKIIEEQNVWNDTKKEKAQK